LLLVVVVVVVVMMSLKMISYRTFERSDG